MTGSKTTEILAPSPEAIARAAALLREGGLVAFPTETVYGLGGDATSDAAVAAIFEAKGRPRFNPLISHVTGLAMAETLAVFGEGARALAEKFWPGPLTLVLPRADGCPVSLLASAGLDTIAVRAPAHPVARDLIAAVGRPLAAPSANPSGSVSPTTAQHVAEGLDGKVRLILDGGPCEMGLESTVVSFAGDAPALLRPGALARDEIEAVTGPLATPEAGPAHSPGQLESHYAPDARLRLDATTVERGEGLLAFGPDAPETDGPSRNLSPTGDLREAAANLFAMLRLLDATGVARIAVMPIPAHGLGEAIRDRLQRAAAPRPASPGEEG